MKSLKLEPDFGGVSRVKSHRCLVHEVCALAGCGECSERNFVIATKRSPAGEKTRSARRRTSDATGAGFRAPGLSLPENHHLLLLFSSRIRLRTEQKKRSLLCRVQLESRGKAEACDSQRADEFFYSSWREFSWFISLQRPHVKVKVKRVTKPLLASFFF